MLCVFDEAAETFHDPRRVSLAECVHVSPVEDVPVFVPE